jgi:quercetin dioxygenase-like cupin family protein
MKRHNRLLITAMIAAVCASLPGAAFGQAGEHKMIAPQDITWRPGPPSVPPGAEAAALYGDPSKEGLFAFRLKLPRDYHIPPHTHPKPEVVTVISGIVRVGMGTSADRDKAQAMPAGSLFAMSPDVVHYVFTDEEAVVQLNSTGPWAVNYVNPKDDPRQTTGTAPAR